MKKLLIAALVVAHGWLATAPVHAAPVLSLVPAATTVAVGGTLRVDLVMSGLDSVGEIVSGFDLDVLYDPAVLRAVSLVTRLEPWGSRFDAASINQSLSDTGRVTFTLMARQDDAILDGLQGDRVVLSSMVFWGLAEGFSTIRYGLDPITERGVLGRGFQPLAHDTTDTCVVVVATGQQNNRVAAANGGCVAQVPEPASWPLVLVALAGVGLVRRQQRSGAGGALMRPASAS